MNGNMSMGTERYTHRVYMYIPVCTGHVTNELGMCVCVC